MKTFTNQAAASYCISNKKTTVTSNKVTAVLDESCYTCICYYKCYCKIRCNFQFDYSNKLEQLIQQKITGR